MWTKPYGKTGTDVSVVGFGGMRFANPTDIDANAAIVMHAYERGVNYFDTAPFYSKDKSEEIMGAAVGQMKQGTFFVSTKCMEADGDKLRASLEKSLRRLKVDRIHFFHIWSVITLDQWRERLAGGAVDAALRARDEGLIEHVVISSHLDGDDLKTVLAEGPFEGVTLGYSAINFPYREKAVEAAGEMGLGVVTMNPLAGGLIPQNAERFGFLRTPDDPSVVAAAIRFNVSHPAITCALVGFTTREHVDEACDAVESFTPYGADRAASIREDVLASFDDLCTGCGYCLPCPEGLNVPRLMDAHNLLMLHPDGQNQARGRLKWHWLMKPEDAAACSLCGQCETRCTQHLPIRERMQAIAALAEDGSEGA